MSSSSTGGPPHLVTSTLTFANNNAALSPLTTTTTTDAVSRQQQQPPQQNLGQDPHDERIIMSYAPSESHTDAGANAPSDDGLGNPLKRRNTEAVDYPRRRATIACEVCRSRKSRCDGTKPKCKLCTELGAECVYREPGVKLDAGDKLILDRLASIEGLVQVVINNQTLSAAAATSSGSGSGLGLGVRPVRPTVVIPAAAASAAATALSDCSPTTSHDTDGMPMAAAAATQGQATQGQPQLQPQLQLHIHGRTAAAAATSSATTPVASSIPHTSLGTWFARPPVTSISTMPRAHTSAAMHLLRWPRIRDLVQRQYDPRLLLRLEMDREPLHSLTKTPSVDLSNTGAYIKSYFDLVNVWYACVNPYTWHAHYRAALTNGFREGPESCIVLLVLALGQASIGGSISRIAPHHDPPGLLYFTAAWSLLPAMMTAHDVPAAQCHLLAAAYLLYLVRPLEAWALLATTATKLQLLLVSPGRLSPDQREMAERIYWNVVLLESDLLAELDLPHSAVVHLEDEVGLPGGFEGDDAECVGRDDLWYFLAEIALRRLLNRAIQLLYSADSTTTTATTTAAESIDPVVAELDFQLTQWYENLPLPLRFSFSRAPIQNPVQAVLRLRFFACRATIYRPYILAVLDDEQACLQPVVREGCERCLEAAVRQIEHITSHHSGHMPYLWQGTLSIVSQALLVMGASMSLSLSAILLTIVPHRAALDRIIAEAVVEVERYAALAPSLGLSAEVLREAEARRRVFLGG